MPETGIPYLRETVLLLVTSVVVVVALNRLRASPVLGYLVAGCVIGPSGFGFLSNVEQVRTFAELGVVFLLFTIGLELSFERLRLMRRLVFGLGVAQVAACGSAIGAATYVLTGDAATAVVIGGALSLSSTAIVLQILVDRGEVASRTGRTGFAILLFQDLAVMPLLVLTLALGPGVESVAAALGAAGLKAAIAIAAIFLAGRYALRRLFRRVAAIRSPELFMALTLLVVLGTAWLTHAAGLSMALGAFLAGLLLAETEFRHQVEADMRPFRALLIGLFFMGVGMSVDFGFVGSRAPWIAGAVIGLIVVKAALIAVLCRLFAVPLPTALRVGLLLSVGGEFAFVVVTTAMTNGVLEYGLGQFALAVAAVSMMLTPLLAVLGERVAKWLTTRSALDEIAGDDSADPALDSHIVIAGFGRVGQTIATLLARQDVPFVAVDLDADRVRLWRRKGLPVYFGDASQAEVLGRLGAGRAAALIVTIDDPDAARRALGDIRQHWPELKVFVRAHDATHLADLQALGATAVVPETFESSLALARHALSALGTPDEAVESLVNDIRRDEAAANGSGLPPSRQR